MRTWHQRRSHTDSARQLSRILAFVVAVPLLMLATVWAPAAHADGTLNIVVPPPNGDLSSGPVGANVSVKGTGISNHHYQIKISSGSDCSSAQSVSGASVTADSAGSFALTFSWPSAFHGVGTSYLVCADDTTAQPTPTEAAATVTPQPTNTPFPTIIATQHFQVTSSLAPKIAIDQAPIPNNGTTPIPTPPPGSFYASGPVKLTGAYFTLDPGSQRLKAYLLIDSHVDANTLQNAIVLNTLDGSNSISIDAQGTFSTTVVLPSSRTGSLYIAVASTDNSANTSLLPSLVVTSSINVISTPPELPTPTPTKVATPSPTATKANGGGGNGGGGAALLGACGLGGLSIVLFIMGVILLAGANGSRARLIG